MSVCLIRQSDNECPRPAELGKVNRGVKRVDTHTHAHTRNRK